MVAGGVREGGGRGRERGWWEGALALGARGEGSVRDAPDKCYNIAQNAAETLVMTGMVVSGLGLKRV